MLPQCIDTKVAVHYSRPYVVNEEIYLILFAIAWRQPAEKLVYMSIML